MIFNLFQILRSPGVARRNRNRARTTRSATDRQSDALGACLHDWDQPLKARGSLRSQAPRTCTSWRSLVSRAALTSCRLRPRVTCASAP
jgi:hypothetical protein